MNSAFHQYARWLFIVALSFFFPRFFFISSSWAHVRESSPRWFSPFFLLPSFPFAERGQSMNVKFCSGMHRQDSFKAKHTHGPLDARSARNHRSPWIAPQEEKKRFPFKNAIEIHSVLPRFFIIQQPSPLCWYGHPLLHGRSNPTTDGPNSFIFNSILVWDADG